MSSLDPNSHLGEPRERFLRRVRAALGRSASEQVAAERCAAEPEPCVFDLSVVRLVAHDADLPAIFMDRAAACGMRVRVVESGGIVPTIEEIMTSHAVKSAMVQVPGPVGEALERSLVSAGVATIGARPSRSLDALYDADVGITDCAAAIAESGTIVVRSDALRSRGAFIVPAVHVAILHEGQIVPDMLDLWPLLEVADVAIADSRTSAGTPSRRKLPTSVVLVTGPSKTADIEGILVTGVHGPGEVHVILVRRARP